MTINKDFSKFLENLYNNPKYIYGPTKQNLVIPKNYNYWEPRFLGMKKFSSTKRPLRVHIIKFI